MGEREVEGERGRGGGQAALDRSRKPVSACKGEDSLEGSELRGMNADDWVKV